MFGPSEIRWNQHMFYSHQQQPNEKSERAREKETPTTNEMMITLFARLIKFANASKIQTHTQRERFEERACERERWREVDTKTSPSECFCNCKSWLRENIHKLLRCIGKISNTSFAYLHFSSLMIYLFWFEFRMLSENIWNLHFGNESLDQLQSNPWTTNVCMWSG